MKDTTTFLSGLALVLGGVFGFGVVWGSKIGYRKAKRELIGSIVKLSHERKKYGNRRPGITPLTVPAPPPPPPPYASAREDDIPVHWCGGGRHQCRGYHAPAASQDSLPKVPKGPAPGAAPRVDRPGRLDKPPTSPPVSSGSHSSEPALLSADDAAKVRAAEVTGHTFGCMCPACDLAKEV